MNCTRPYSKLKTNLTEKYISPELLDWLKFCALLRSEHFRNYMRGSHWVRRVFTSGWLSLGLFVSLLMHSFFWPYPGMCIWEWWGVNLILGPRDSGHSEPGVHKKTFLLSVVPIVRHKQCFLQSVTTTLQNAYAPDDTTGAPLVSLEDRKKEEKGGVLKACSDSVHDGRFEAKL